MNLATPLIKVEGVSKCFGSLQANDNVNLSINEGEIHALLGENGAGKSTLIKIIYGVQQADAGNFYWKGKAVQITNPLQARSLGIGVVFQHFSLFRAMTVADNIALGLPASSCVNLEDRITGMSKRYGFDLDPLRPLYSLSVGEWQRVEIVRCLLVEPRLLILDEPTSVLTPQEAELLFLTLRKLASEGCSVLYISHRLVEIKDLCTVATVMRGGQVVSRCDPTNESLESLAQMMIGKKLVAPERSTNQIDNEDGSLIIDKLSLPKTGPFGVDLDNINLKVVAGKIVAIAGIAGNGQSELGAVLEGAQLVNPDVIRCGQNNVGNLSPRKRRDIGIRYVPEVRNGHAAVPQLSLSENISITSRDGEGMNKWHMLSRSNETKLSEQIIKTYDVRCDGSKAVASSLSGGNMQKFIIGREVTKNPRILIVMQPTWGVDAGAASQIHQALIDLAAQGSAVLVISQDLDEILAIADEVAVISDGKLSEPKPAQSLTPDQIGLMMGATVKEEHVA